jgi:hypothetical protein
MRAARHLCILLFGVVVLPVFASAETKIALVDGRWQINGEVTHAGTRAEGLLLNVRMVNSTYEDRHDATRPKDFDAEANAARFIAQIPAYDAAGVSAFTLCLQGGMPGYEGALNSAFEADGGLRPDYLARVERVIRACDRQGMAVILGLFYQRQSKLLKDDDALRAGVVNAVRWVQDRGFPNVLIEIANEYPHPGFTQELIRSPKGLASLLRLARETAPGLLFTASGYGNGSIHAEVAAACDFLTPHFNSTPVEKIPERLAALKKFGKPIVCNEDHKAGRNAADALRVCVENGAGYGLMLQEKNQHAPFEFAGEKDDPVFYTALRELTAPPAETRSADGPGRVIVPATDDFPRNGEGSMVLLQDRGILQLYGAQNGTGDWAIGVIREIRSSDGGQTWSEPRTVFTDPERSLFQPSLTRMANGDLGLTYTSLLPKLGAFKVFRHSTDDGQTWSDPVPISDPALPHSTGPWDKLYTLSNGRVIALLHSLLVLDISKNAGPRGTYAMFSDDQGRTWQRAPREGTLRVEDKPFDSLEWGFWEPALVELSPGHLLLLGRTATGWLYESRSADYGTTWTDPVRSSVPNPIAPPVLTKVPGTNTLVLLQNPRVAMGVERLGGLRTLLGFRTSRDDGRTWSAPQPILESKDGAHWHDYPAILWRDGQLHLASRQIEILNGRSWTKVSLYHLTLPASRF